MKALFYLSLSAVAALLVFSGVREVSSGPPSLSCDIIAGGKTLAVPKCPSKPSLHEHLEVKYSLTICHADVDKVVDPPPKKKIRYAAATVVHQSSTPGCFLRDGDRVYVTW